jgi:hypothetical protein
MDEAEHAGDNEHTLLREGGIVQFAITQVRVYDAGVALQRRNRRRGQHGQVSFMNRRRLCRIGYAIERHARLR